MGHRRNTPKPLHERRNRRRQEAPPPRWTPADAKRVIVDGDDVTWSSRTATVEGSELLMPGDELVVKIPT